MSAGLLSATVLLPVAAVTVPAYAADPGVDVTIALAPGRPTALARAASQPARADTHRAAAVVAPSQQARDHVTTWLRDHGLTVTGGDAWKVTVRAAAGTVRRLFPDGRVPDALRADARAVVGVEQQRVWHHRAGYTSGDLRRAYSTADAARGLGTTVASIQFSGWSQLAGTSGGGDLVEYATATGLPVPSLTAVSVNGADVARPDYPGDDFEVALDQEAILAGAPLARQRVYVTTNDRQGAVLAWQRLAADVASGLRIAAVATSWGDCEQDLGADTIRAIEDQIELLTAMGVTVFASTGDNGAYDCPAGTPWAGQPAVDFPASSPHAVAVGGTDLAKTADGRWAETAWGPDALAPGRADAGGGGPSSVFPRPGWQAGAAGLPSARLVPDIASAAAPDVGFSVYWSGDGTGQRWWTASGTSVGAPLQAALYASTLSSLGRTRGVGNLLPVLYAHPEGFRDVVTGGNGTYLAGAGYDLATGLGAPQWQTLAPALTQPVLSLPAGSRDGTVTYDATIPSNLSVGAYTVGEGPQTCDTPTGEATPATGAVQLSPGDRATSIGLALAVPTGCLTMSTPVVLDTRAPVVTASLAADGPGRLTARWSATDPAPSSGLGYRIELTTESGGSAPALWFTTYAAAGGFARITVPTGAAYRLRVTATDGAGNVSSPAVTDPVAMRAPQVAVRGVNGQMYVLRSGGWVPVAGTLTSSPAVVGWRSQTYYLGTDTNHRPVVRTGGADWQPLDGGQFCWQVNGAVVGDTLYVTCETQQHRAFVAWGDVTAGALPTLGGWHDLGVTASGPPAAAVVGGRLTFVATTTSGQPAWRTLDTPAWQPLPGSCTGAPALAALDGLAYLACRGPAGDVVYRQWVAGAWSAPRSLGGQTAGPPGLAVLPDGLRVYAPGINGAVYVRTLQVGWWPLGGAILGGVGAGAV